MTPSPLLPYQEEDALRRILAHHARRARPEMTNIVHEVIRDYNSLSGDDGYDREIDQIADLFLSRSLVNALAALIQWVRQSEQARAKFATSSPGTPPDLLSLLGQLGIYGGEAIGPSPTGVS